MSTATYLRTRVDRSPLVPGLLAGDAIALLIFAGMGISHHGGDPLADPVDLVLTAAPFLIAWGTVALLGGLYTVDALASPLQALSRALPAWIVAALVGQGLRTTAFFPGNTQLSFVLVTLLFGGLLVVGWRVVAATLRSYA